MIAIGVILIMAVIVIAVICAAWKIPQQPQPEFKPYLKFRKGTTITCPKCSRVIGEACRDIYSNEIRSSIPWIGMPYQWDSLCPDDKERCMIVTVEGVWKLHTTEGWISRSPEVSHATR